jgi:hypothetical protein
VRDGRLRTKVFSAFRFVLDQKWDIHNHAPVRLTRMSVRGEGAERGG